MGKDDILAIVGNKSITQNEVDTLIQSLDPQTAMQFYSEDGRKRILEELINQELFYLYAVDCNMEKEDSFISEIGKIKTNFLKQYAIGKLLNNIRVTNEEIEAYYNENKDQFKNPESMKASHILVDNEDKAIAILDEINGGLSFEDAAREYSSCPSKAQGGDLGYFTKGRMVPGFEQAAFEMEIDEVSIPVKTQFGFHIIKITDKKQSGEKSLDEVRGQLQKELLTSKQESIYFKKINELKGKYEIKVNI